MYPKTHIRVRTSRFRGRANGTAAVAEGSVGNRAARRENRSQAFNSDYDYNGEQMV